MDSPAVKRAPDRLRPAVAWLRRAVCALRRVEGRYAEVGGAIGDNDRYVRGKRHFFTHLAAQLDVAVPEGEAAVLRVLAGCRVEAFLAAELGPQLLALLEGKRVRLATTLARWVIDGSPLPDPDDAI